MVVERLLLHLVAAVLVVPPPGGHAPEAAVPGVIRLEVRYVVVLSCCWVTGRLVVSSHARHVFDKDELSLKTTPTLFYHCAGTGTHLETVTSTTQRRGYSATSSTSTEERSLPPTSAYMRTPSGLPERKEYINTDVKCALHVTSLKRGQVV